MKLLDPIEFHEILIPEYWLCYLINGDHSGYTDDEIEAIDKFISKRKVLGTVDDDEGYPIKHLREFRGLFTECVEAIMID
jgi:hypothetical protein